MSKRNGGKKKHRSKKQGDTRIEKMLDRMRAFQIKAHLGRKPKKAK